MVNITEAFNILDQNNFTINSKFFTENNKQIFSDIFNNEKRNLLFGKLDIAKNIVHNEQNKIKNSINQMNNSNSINKPHNKFKPNAADNKIPLNKTKQLKKYKDANIDELTENIEEKAADGNTAVSLQSILLAMLENILCLENMDNEDIKIDADQLQELDSLKGQLLSLLETANTLSGDSFKQNIETIIDIINKTNDELLLHNNGQLSILKSDEVKDNIEEIKNNMQSILNRPNIIKSANPQSLYIKDNLLNLEEEQLTKSEETLLNMNNIEKDIKNSAKPIDKFILGNSEEQFFKQFKEDNEILFKEQIIVFQQGANNQDINLKVIKDQIIEPRQFISEIAQKAGIFILKGKNEMSIQLIPENLGKLSIKIGLNEGSLTGKIYAENYSVKETIEANLDQLKDSLEGHGFNIASLEVYINDNSQNFERSLYQSTFANRQRPKTSSIETNSKFITLEEDVEKTNPYLITSQIDSLV